jgi:hypothetical protein
MAEMVKCERCGAEISEVNRRLGQDYQTNRHYRRVLGSAAPKFSF